MLTNIIKNIDTHSPSFPPSLPPLRLVNQVRKMDKTRFRRRAFTARSGRHGSQGQMVSFFFLHLFPSKSKRKTNPSSLPPSLPFRHERTIRTMMAERQVDGYLVFNTKDAQVTSRLAVR